jgi:hypothetical protein
MVLSLAFPLTGRNGDGNVDVTSNSIGKGADFVGGFNQFFGLLLVNSCDSYGECRSVIERVVTCQRVILSGLLVYKTS